MALITIPGGFELPGIPAGIGSGFVFSASAVIDSASEKVAICFQIPKTGNVRKIHLATKTVTTGATIAVRLETTDTGSIGRPSGTLVGANTENAAVVVGSGDDNTFFAITLTADAAVTMGQRVAVVIVNPAVSAGNMVIAAQGFGYDVSLPYSAIDPSPGDGSYGFGTNQAWLLMVALEYDDATVVPIPSVYPPCTLMTSTGLSTSTTPDVAGLRFQLPFPARIIGGWVWAEYDGNFALKLVSTAYNQAGGTGILASVTIDSEERRNATDGLTRLLFTAPFDAVAGTTYRLVVEPTTTTSVNLYDMNTMSLLGLDAVPGARNFHLTTAKDPTADGDWTNFNSGTFRRPMMGLLIDQFADDTGGAVTGGGLRMAGHGGLAA